MSNIDFNFNGELGEHKSSFSEEKVVYASDEIEKYLNEIIKDNKLYRFGEFEKIVKELGFDVTRRTIDYYIKEGLLDEMMIPSGKKQGYLTANHIYKYTAIAVMKDSLSLERIKKIFSFFKNDDLKLIEIVILTARKENEKIIDNLINEVNKMLEDDLKDKIMCLIQFMSAAKLYNDTAVSELNKLVDDKGGY